MGKKRWLSSSDYKFSEPPPTTPLQKILVNISKNMYNLTSMSDNNRHTGQFNWYKGFPKWTT
jgi:hypothetical protein